MYFKPGRAEKRWAIQPDGVRVLMPRPLSSQTISIGIGMPWNTVLDDVLNAPTKVEWFTEASPKLVTTMASVDQGVVIPSRLARSNEYARPTARGRCEAIVDVCGITARSTLPNTLCRPPAMGSVVAAATPSRISRTGSCPGRCRARAQ